MIVAAADNLMVGRLGALELAAVSLGNTLVFVAMAVGIGFSFSITPLIAQYDAQSNFRASKQVLDSGLLLCLSLGVSLCGLLFISESLLFHLDQPEDVVVLAIPYMRYLSISMVPLLLFQGLKQFCDGLSHTRLPMIAAIIANVFNVFLNYLFIYGKFGLPRMEVEGAGVGTLASRILMLVILLIALSRKRTLSNYLNYFVFWSNKTIKRLIFLGTPTALQMLFEVGLFTAAIFLAGTLGVNSQAANQIALNLSSLTFMFGVGLGVTATIRVGNQLGIHDYASMKRIVFSLLIMTLVMELLFATIFVLGRSFLPSLYIDDTTVIEITAGIMLIAGLFQISDGFQVVLIGVLRGLQDVWIPSVICFVAYGLIGLPISYWLGLKSGYGVSGIWIGLLVALTVSSILLYSRFHAKLSGK
jgi:MATE family multidrug resistance protein